MKTPRRGGNEKGFASIVIALVLIIVLSLLTVGFAQLARREQQNALDKQLADQANYAAESGINDVIQGLKTGNINDDPTAATGYNANVDTTSCLVPPGSSLWSGGPNSTIDASRETAYTCEIVNLTPPSIVKNPLATGNVWATTFSTSDVNSGFVVKWTSTHNNDNFGGIKSNGFLPAATWNAQGRPPLLQVSITPLRTPLTRDSLAADTYTVYLYPTGSPGTGNWQAGIGNMPQNGQILDGGCSIINVTSSNPYTCSATINGFGSLAAGTPYLVRVVDYYDESSVEITSTDGVKFLHSQAVVDSTGTARNVLKRLKAVVPIDNLSGGTGSGFPAFGLQAGDICKRFTTNSIAPPTVVAPAGAGTACDLN